jgi:hypothetical protein
MLSTDATDADLPHDGFKSHFIIPLQPCSPIHCTGAAAKTNYQGGTNHVRRLRRFERQVPGLTICPGNAAVDLSINPAKKLK